MMHKRNRIVILASRGRFGGQGIYNERQQVTGLDTDKITIKTAVKMDATYYNDLLYTLF